jgi:hypothetical protein
MKSDYNGLVEQSEMNQSVDKNFNIIQDYTHIAAPLTDLQRNLDLSQPELLQTYINFPRFLPIFSAFLERLLHSAPIY